MTKNLLHKVSVERFLPSEYPEGLLFESEIYAPCGIVFDASEDGASRYLDAHGSEYDVYRNPSLSIESKLLYTLINTFKGEDAPLPKTGWFIDNMRISPSEFFFACEQLRSHGLIEEGELS